MTTARTWKSLAVMMMLALMLALVVQVGMPMRIEAGIPTVLINEFVSWPQSGNDWVELFNTTDSPIDLTDWYITIAVDGGAPTALPLAPGFDCLSTIPGTGLLVFEPTGDWLPDNPANKAEITIFNGPPGPGTAVHSVQYGPAANNPPPLSAPSAGKSAARFDDDPLWRTDQTPTKGWYNNAAGMGNEALGIPPELSAIQADLATQGINSNIGELPNPSSTPTGDAGLYFEKTGFGKMLLTTCLNLSNKQTRDTLQSLGDKIGFAAAQLRFDSDTATAMEATGAKLFMYRLPFTSMPDLTVLTDAGAVIPPGSTNYPTITDKNFANGTFSFGINHFTQYKAVERPVIQAPPPPPGGADDSSYGESRSTTLRSAAMKVRYLKVAPQQAYTNQPVVVTTNVINDGGDGSYNVMLRINDRVEETRTVSVSGGTAKQVKFTVTKSQPGTYTVQVGNEKSMFTVIAGDKVSESAPMNEGMLVVVLFGALLLVMVIVLMLAFRRPA